VDRVHGRAHGPLWTDGGTDRRPLGHNGALAGKWPPATLRHGSSPREGAKERWECVEPISSLIGAWVVVRRSGDSDKAPRQWSSVVAVLDLKLRGK
jgi:hypothetical protein